METAQITKRPATFSMCCLGACSWLLLLFSSFALGQTRSTGADSLLQELNRLESKMILIQQQKENLVRQIDSLAAVIGRQKAERKFLQESRLEENLRRSDLLAQQYQALQQQEKVLTEQLKEQARRNLPRISRLLHEIAAEMEVVKARGTAATLDSLARTLQRLRKVEQRYQRILRAPPAGIALLSVVILPDDPPAVIRQKIDYLLDQADRLADLVKRADQTIQDLEHEIRLRRRLQEFVQDIQLLDPTGEAAVQPGQQSQILAQTKIAERELAYFDLALQEGAVITIIPEWPTNLEALSDEDLQEWIQRLAADMRTWQHTADSLKARALQLEKLMEKK